MLYNFLQELTDCLDGKIDRVRHASTLTNHGIRIHKQRLERLGYQIHYDIEHRDDQPVHNNDMCTDVYFKTTCTMIPVFLNTSYIRNGQVVYSSREDKKFTAYIEDLVNSGNTLAEDMLINCPNCGKAGTVNSFRDGCVGCGTHFEMTDVYPSVGSSYFMDNYFVGGRDMSTPAKKVGTAIDAYKKFFQMLKKAPMAIDAVNTISLTSFKQYQEFMRQYRPDFAYLHFANAAISMMTMMMYSDAPDKLPFNKMANTPVIAPNLLDFYIEGFGINHGEYSVDGDIAKITCTLIVTSMYDVSGKVRKASEKFQATFIRDINKPISHGFSFTKINCPSCGSAFDAMKAKFCPYCGSKYELNNEEWVIVDMNRV